MSSAASLSCLVLALMITAAPGCSRDATSKQTASDDKGADLTPPKGARSPGAPAPKGVTALRSLPRDDWPCGYTTRGIEFGLEYSPDLDECWFPPDHWEPGCPVRNSKRSWSYDDSQRLSSYSELGVETYGTVVYEGRAVISSEPARLADESGGGNKVTYRLVGDAIEGLSNGRKHVEVHLEGGRIADVITYSVSDGSVSSRAVHEWNGSKLLRTTGTFPGMDEPAWEFEWNYDCSD